jgi:hypothetical protein
MYGGWDEARAMWRGQGHLRFLVQPTAAIVLGILDGRRDAREGRAPFGVHVAHATPAEARAHLVAALRRMVLPLTMAIVLSAVFQWIVLHKLHPLGSLSFAVFLVALPYGVARGLANRASRRWPRPRRGAVAET